MVEGFNEAFKKRVIQWHEDFSFELKAEMLEEVLVRTIYDLGIDFSWKAGSHTSGVDVVIPTVGRLSVKSGKENKGKIIISSSRTTKYNSIENKVRFYKEVENSFDSYFLLSKDITKNSIIYTPYLIPKENISIDKLVFRKETFGWYGECESFYFTIVKSMSDQIWIYLTSSFYNDFKLEPISFHKEEKPNGLTLYESY